MLDFTLLTALQRRLMSSQVIGDRIKFRTMMNCNRQPLSAFMPAGSSKDSSIEIRSNGERVKFSGLVACNNSWCCPICSPRLAVRQFERLRVAMAYQLLHEHNKAIMLTITVPHYRFETADDVFDRLRRLVRNLLIDAKNTKRKSPIARLFAAMNFQAHYGAYECTYTPNGFHFHLHMIVFCKTPENLTEEIIKDATVSFYASTYRRFKKQHPNFDMRNYYEFGSGSMDGLYISRTKSGEIRQTGDCRYLFEHLTDLTKEVTQLYSKSVHQYSRHMFQLLESDSDEDWKAYYQFMQATSHKTRYIFSKYLFVNFDEQQKFVESQIGKCNKLSLTGEPRKKFVTVARLSSEDWYKLMEIELCYRIDIRSLIEQWTLQSVHRLRECLDFLFGVEILPPLGNADSLTTMPAEIVAV